MGASSLKRLWRTDYLTKPENRKKFLSNIQQEFEEWRSLALYLEEESEKYYKKYVLSYVNHFAQSTLSVALLFSIFVLEF
jgi:hypothetical protein